MKWVLIILGALVAIVAIMALIGAIIPRTHVASTRAEINAPPAEVFSAITNVDEFTKWRTGLKSVEKLPPKDEKPHWREVSDFGPMKLVQLEAIPNSKVVGEVADEGSAWGGTWTYEIAPSAKGSTVTITERGFVNNVFFRFLSRFAFGYHGAQEGYLKSLAAKFGDPNPVLTRL